jgi:hypothetical protein
MPKAPKKKRPVKGRDPLIALRVPVDERQAVEEFAELKGLTLSKAIRELVAAGLKARRAK